MYTQVCFAAQYHLVTCISINPKLTKLYFDPPKHYSLAVDFAALQSAGVLMPPMQVVSEGWDAVLQFLRVRGVCARSRNLPRHVFRHRTPLQLPSPPSQKHLAMPSLLSTVAGALVQSTDTSSAPSSATSAASRTGFGP